MGFGISETPHTATPAPQCSSFFCCTHVYGYCRCVQEGKFILEKANILKVRGGDSLKPKLSEPLLIWSLLTRCCC